MFHSGGREYLEDHFIGVGMMLKDSASLGRRMSGVTFVFFRSQLPHIQTTSSVLAPIQCQSWHVEFASKENYVFTDTHTGLTSSIIH